MIDLLILGGMTAFAWAREAQKRGGEADAGWQPASRSSCDYDDYEQPARRSRQSRRQGSTTAGSIPVVGGDSKTDRLMAKVMASPSARAELGNAKRIEFHDDLDGAWGMAGHDGTVMLKRGLSERQLLHTLGHELKHLKHGDQGQVESQERRADEAGDRFVRHVYRGT